MEKTKPEPDPSVNPAEVTLVQPPYKVILEWKAPSRPYKKRNREFFTTIGAIVFLLAVILLFLKEWLLIGAIIALAFLSYVLASVEPEEVDYKITTRGIEVGNKKYPWGRMGRFWFSKKWGSLILHIEYLGLPAQLQLLYDGKNIKKEDLKKILSRYLIFERPEKTPIDKAAEWLQKKIPLEREAVKTPPLTSKK